MTTMTTPPGPTSPAGPETDAVRPSMLRVLRDQRKILMVAGVLMVASVWVLAPMGNAELGGCLAAGVGLGLLNHLFTEFWLLKVISSGDNPTRNQMAASTFVRLVILTVVAVAIAVMFWPYGIGVLLGLAIFRLIALVMTSIPLLKELKKA